MCAHRCSLPRLLGTTVRQGYSHVEARSVSEGNVASLARPQNADGNRISVPRPECRHTTLGDLTHHEPASKDTAIETAQQLCPTPTIETDCVCIVDRENVTIAAVVSSYFGDRATYFAIFDFPRLQHANGPDTAFEDDAFIARMIGNEHAVVINNALAKLRTCQRVILAGLDDAQESYLNLSEEFEVIRIADVGAVDAAITRIGLLRTRELRCRPGPHWSLRST